MITNGGKLKPARRIPAVSLLLTTLNFKTSLSENQKAGANTTRPDGFPPINRKFRGDIVSVSDIFIKAEY